MDQENFELLTALQARSPRAFEQLFDLYSNKMFRLAAGMCGNEEEAEDVVQDAFLKFFEKMHAFEGRSMIGTWLYRTTHNACIDRIRKRKPVLAWDDAEAGPLSMPQYFNAWQPEPEGALASAELQAELTAAMTKLPESLRAVFLLRDVEELSTQEVADILAISMGAVKVRLHRARLQLRELLAPYFLEQAKGV